MTGPGRPPVGKVVEVRLPPDLADAVRHTAKTLHVSAAEIHRRALTEYLSRTRQDGTTTYTGWPIKEKP